MELRLNFAFGRMEKEVAMARRLDPNYRPPSSFVYTPDGELDHYEYVARHARAAIIRSETEAFLARRGPDAPQFRYFGGRFEAYTPEQAQRLQESFDRLVKELSRVRVLDPYYRLPGNFGSNPLHSRVEDEIRQNETTAYFAKEEADRLERLSFDRGRHKVDESEMQAALVLERHFRLIMRRPDENEKEGKDFIDNRGTTWDFFGTSVEEETMEYAKFQDALKRKIERNKVDKIAVDTRRIGEVNFQKIIAYIRKQSAEIQSKIVIITEMTVVGSDR